MPFAGLDTPRGVAVDSDGNVYVTDDNTYVGILRVLKLAPGAAAPVELPFPRLHDPQGVAVDNAGNVYVTDYDVDNNNAGRVLKLSAQ